ncbi:aspartyl protease family protein [Candidatus Micrarchaeota archaeon]|nr:aspartyl protease family protein [Candidatus Micrarchaeota archaeon]
MEIEFKFREGHSRIFGKTLRPVADVTLRNGDRDVVQGMIVDSGADVTLIPKSVGDYIGFKINNEKIVEVKGIGDRGIPVVLKKAFIRIGEKEIDAIVAWSLIEEVPLLLGRKDVFDKFQIIFKDNTSIFRY